MVMDITKGYSLNLRHLAVFHTVAETGSLSKAAERLFITQPAVSRQLKSLEDALGLMLLDREPRGVRLTEAGRVLEDYASRIFSLSARARASMEEISNLKSGRLSLGASSTIGNYLLPPVLAQFRITHPGMDIRLQIGNTEAIQHLLLEDEIDFGFTEGFVEHQELESRVFTHDELAIIAHADHPLANSESTDLATLCPYPWVMRETGSGTQAVLEHILGQHGCSEPRSVFTLGSTEAVKAAVLAGAGIAGVSYLTVINEINAGSLVRIPCRDAIDFHRPLHQVRHRNRHAIPAVDAFLALLSQTVASNKLSMATDPFH